MPHFDEVSYSKSACIAAIKDYYNFLISMYLDESSVEWPPEGGWPQITSELFSVMNKSDRVISLLRQIPYLRELNDLSRSHRPHGVPNENFCNWKNQAAANDGDDPEQMRQLTYITEGAYFNRTTEHMCGIMMMSYRNASPAIIDTQYGVVYWPDCDDEIKDSTKFEQVTGQPEDIGSEQEHNIRSEPAWTIPDFFAMLREQFLNLNWLPINSRQVIEAYTFQIDEDLQPILQGIYRGHGWPDLKKYKKKECIGLVEQTVKERDADFDMS